MNNDAIYIVRVFRNPRRGEAYPKPVADIEMTGPIYGSETRFARRHGGDFVVCLSQEDVTELTLYY
jgi:hypothetical protein